MSTTLQLQLESRDEAEVAEIEAVLSSAGQLAVERWRQARVVDPITIMSVSGGIVALVNGLLSLRDRWVTRKKPPSIIVENETGDQIDLTQMTREELERLITAD